MGDADEEMIRLRTAMDIVQADLDRSVVDAPRLQLIVVEHDESWAEISEDHFEAYVAGPDGAYWGASGSPLRGPTADAALYSVADGAQDYLIEVERTVWPVCPRHDRGVHVRPPGTGPDWIHEGGEITGPSVWWCRGSGGHDVAVIGELELRRPSRPGSRSSDGEPGVTTA
jgi:hypothetical protein